MTILLLLSTRNTKMNDMNLHPQEVFRIAEDVLHKAFCQICAEHFTLWTFRQYYKRGVHNTCVKIKRNSSELLIKRINYFFDSSFIFYTYLRRFSNLRATIITPIIAIRNKFPEHLQPKSEYSLFSFFPIFLPLVYILFPVDL